MKSLLVLMRELQVTQPHIWVHEITRTKGLDAIWARHLGGHYNFWTLNVSPRQLGYPIDRPRTYTFGIRRDLSWVGNPQEFRDLFGVEEQGFCASAFCKDPGEFQVMKASCKVPCDQAQTCADLELKDCLAPGGLAILEEWRAFRKRCGLGVLDKVPAFFVDVNQHVGYSTAGSVVPTLSTTSRIVNLGDPDKEHFFTGKECLLAMGSLSLTIASMMFRFHCFCMR